MSSRNKHGYTGVVEYRDNKWKANLLVDGENICVGIFPTKVESAKMYCEYKISPMNDTDIYMILTDLFQNIAWAYKIAHGEDAYYELFDKNENGIKEPSMKEKLKNLKLQVR